MKLSEQLNKQLKSQNATMRDCAQKCKTIYNAVLRISEGHVWNSDWSTLAKMARCEGEFYWKPTEIGEIFLLGIKMNEGQGCSD